MAPPRQRKAPDHARIARIRRDDSLARINTLTKSVGIGVLAVTGVLGLYLGKALPGHSSSPSSTSSPAANTTQTGSAGSANTSSSGQLAPPSSPPVQSQQQAPVVTGSS